MAASTAPAAVPGPDEQPTTPPAVTPSGRLLGSLFTPVEPARQAVPMAAPGTLATGPEGATAMSSAAFHDLPTATPDNNGNSTPQTGHNSTPKAREGVIRALFLAVAERLKKGAGANIKRLEIEKVRAAGEAAAARTRQVNTKTPEPKAPQAPNRAPAPKPSPAPRTSPTPSPRPKAPAPGPAPKQPAPKPSTPAPKPPAPAPAAKNTAPAPKPVKPQAPLTTTNPAPTPKTAPSKTPFAPQKTTDGKSSSVREKTSKDNTQTSSSSKNDSSKASGTKDSKQTDAKTPRPTNGKSSTPDTAKPQAAGGTKDTANGKGTGTGKGSTEMATKVPEPRKPTDTRKDTRKPAETTPEPSKSAGPKNPAPNTDGLKQTRSQQTPTGPLFTREARETGYRDGHRAARLTAKGKAYKDGVKDGWDAAMDTADAEKTLLDRARDLRKEDRKDPTVTPTAPTTPTAGPGAASIPPKPTHTPATPLTVTGIDATHVHLGDDANRLSMTRGEVRNLKGFERRLIAHHSLVQSAAEATKGLAFHAGQQAESITRLYEQAKAVKGGDKLLGKLAHLEEAARLQATLAEDAHQRAVRGADATAAVLANVTTRYGSLYQAVVDSDETVPAELDFYKG
ncbi:hypothetical protein ACFQ8W_01695 [Streptomyces sp. NPDC056508]|uniref:hypothetical protein n=1 Tax=Streptomyces sp. NPDC056508 TaxID=3345845 RepID=UPI0036C111C6